MCVKSGAKGQQSGRTNGHPPYLLDERKPTGRLLVAIQPHDDTLDASA